MPLSNIVDNVTNRLTELPPLREIAARLQLSPIKALGQNFIFDMNLTRRIARAAAPLTDFDVIEIGAGPGGLTRALLLEGAQRVVAIEPDPRCQHALAEIAATAPERIKIIKGDARKIELATLTTRPYKIVANLPYHIATALIIRWLDADTAPTPLTWSSLTLMVQKEVAIRLCAAPATPAFGRLSVLTNWRAQPKILFDVPPQAFIPQPKVTSTLVQILPRTTPDVDTSPVLLQKITAAAFGQRRKMLRSSLKSLHYEPQRWLNDAGIDPRLRAEQISVEQFCALARCYHSIDQTPNLKRKQSHES